MSPWREKYQDHWFNGIEPDATACVCRFLGEGENGRWFAMNLLWGEVESFSSAREAMEYVDLHPELFPDRENF